jgi:tRNA A-37 threonylcarbamoyl transferase component Bud32
MKLPLWYSRRISKALTPQSFNALCSNAQVLEQDARGIKVIRLADGDILKVFRVKHLVSSARLYSYARQFCRNAERLQVLGIPTVEIRELFHFTDSSNSAVLYRPLSGMTVRQLVYAKQLDEAQLKKLGAFIGSLHDKGIYFRSLHMGNVVLGDDGDYGLIDVADMSIFPWRLGCSRRLRNLYHVCRLQEDIRQLSAQQWQALWQGYFQGAGLSSRCHGKMNWQLGKLLTLIYGQAQA